MTGGNRDGLRVRPALAVRAALLVCLLVSLPAKSESVRPWFGVGGSVSPLSGADIVADGHGATAESPLALGLGAEVGLLVPPIRSVIPSLALVHEWWLDTNPESERTLDSRHLLLLPRVRVVVFEVGPHRVLPLIGFGYGVWWQHQPAAATSGSEPLRGTGLVAELGVAYQVDLSATLFLEGCVTGRLHRAEARNGDGYFAGAGMTALSLPISLQLGYALP